MMVEKVLDLLENVQPGVGDEIQLTDALDQMLKFDGLNAVETDAAIYDCGNKQGFIGANLAVAIRDPLTKIFVRQLIKDLGI